MSKYNGQLDTLALKKLHPWLGTLTNSVHIRKKLQNSWPRKFSPRGKKNHNVKFSIY